MGDRTVATFSITLLRESVVAVESAFFAPVRVAAHTIAGRSMPLGSGALRTQGFGFQEPAKEGVLPLA